MVFEPGTGDLGKLASYGLRWKDPLASISRLGLALKLDSRTSAMLSWLQGWKQHCFQRPERLTPSSRNHLHTPHVHARLLQTHVSAKPRCGYTEAH